MPLIKLNSQIFDAIEATQNFPDVTLDNQIALDWMTQGDPAGDPTVLQLSSSLIRIEQDLWVNGGSDLVTLELRVIGAGLKPVSNMDALINAINDGLATGTLSKFAILSGTDEVLSLSLGASGYVLASGAQSLTLAGTLPLSFTQFYDLADLFATAANLDLLTRAQRLALFQDLSAYSVSGFEFKDGDVTLFGANVSATTASLTLNGITFTLTGTFPDNLGEDLSLLWDAAATARTTGDLSSLARFTSADVTVTRLTITDAAGTVLARIDDPTQDTPVTWTVDGRSFDEVQLDEAFVDSVLNGAGGTARSVLAGQDGSDALYGFGSSDRLYGGTGNDLLNGGMGADLLDGGAGRDAQTGGGGKDVFVFNLKDGFDRITDFAEGVDVIRIAAASSLGDLQFTRDGKDVHIDFRTIHIVVEDITIAQLRHIENFQF